MKFASLLSALSITALLASTAGADVPLNNLSNANASGVFASSLGSGAMVDDLEIDGLAGTPFAVAIQRVQAAFVSSVPGLVPSGFRVDIYTFDENALRAGVGNVYSQVVPLTASAALIPYPNDPNANGNFPSGAFLADLFLPQGGPILSAGAYYISIIAISPTGGDPFFVFGSDTATVGSPNNAINVVPGSIGPQLIQTNTNAAYRVFAVPGPGAAALLGLAGLAASRRRR